MNINRMQSASENLIKKFASKNIPERVSSSARIAGLKGNEQQRAQLASDLNDRLFEIINDIFEQKIKSKKKPKLEKKELLDCIKQVIPDINMRVVYKKDVMYDAFIKNITDKTKKTVIGFGLNLQGAVKKGGEDEVNLRHEMRHVFDFVTQPKILARSNTDSLVGKIEDYSKGMSMYHFKFYENFFYKPQQNKNIKKEMNFLSKNVREHFEALECQPEEQIEILQSWRHLLKTEVNAYTDQTKSAFKGEKTDETIEKFAFRPKIKLIEKMLNEEIAGIRKLNAQKWGTKQ